MFRRCSVNVFNVFEQNSLVSYNFYRTPNLVIKCSSAVSTFVSTTFVGTFVVSLYAIGVVIRKLEPRSLLLSMYLLSRATWRDQVGPCVLF